MNLFCRIRVFCARYTGYSLIFRWLTEVATGALSAYALNSHNYEVGYYFAEELYSSISLVKIWPIKLSRTNSMTSTR